MENMDEQTNKELEYFLLQFEQQQLTEELVKEQIASSLKHLEDLHYEIRNVALNLELQFMRMKAVYKKDGSDDSSK